LKQGSIDSRRQSGGSKDKFDVIHQTLREISMDSVDEKAVEKYHKIMDFDLQFKSIMESLGFFRDLKQGVKFS